MKNYRKTPGKSAYKTPLRATIIGLFVFGQSACSQDNAQDLAQESTQEITQEIAQEITMDSDDKKFSYAIGTKIGEQLAAQFSAQPGVDVSLVLEGINAVVNGEELRISEQEATAIIQQRQQQELALAAEEAEKQQALSQEFLAENATLDGVKSTESGLQYRVIESGDPAGISPTSDDTVVVHYAGTLIDGTVFDSSYARGEPATFPVQGVIPGWTEVLQLMRPGDKWAIVLPPELAYGERGTGQQIGPNAVLKFDVELLEVRQSAN